MFEYYFTFRSITAAQRGERALQKEGLRCSLQRAPKYLALKGCGYALKVRSGEALAAAAAMDLWNVDYGKIYRVSLDGSVEETVL